MTQQRHIGDSLLARWRERRRAKRQQGLEGAFFAQASRAGMKYSLTDVHLSDPVDSWTGFGDGGAGGGCGGGF